LRRNPRASDHDQWHKTAGCGGIHVAGQHLVAARTKTSATGKGEVGLTTQTEIVVYKAGLLTSLLYGCETWTMNSRQLRILDLRYLRKIMKISWVDRVPNTEVLQRAQICGAEALIMKAQLR